MTDDSARERVRCAFNCYDDDDELDAKILSVAGDLRTILEALSQTDEGMVGLLKEALDSLEFALEPWNGAAKVNGTAFIKRARAAIEAMRG